MPLRPETPEDFPSIRDVHLRAFPTEEEADLVEALRAEGAHVAELSLVAFAGDEVVGHILYSRATLDSGHEVLALAPMAVLPDHQRTGIGGALIRASLRAASATAFPLIAVVGHAGYYPRFGFEPADPLGLACPFPVPSESWLAHRLPAYTPQARGTLHYAKAFA